MISPEIHTAVCLGFAAVKESELRRHFSKYKQAAPAPIGDLEIKLPDLKESIYLNRDDVEGLVNDANASSQRLLGELIKMGEEKASKLKAPVLTRADIAYFNIKMQHANPDNLVGSFWGFIEFEEGKLVADSKESTTTTE